MSVIPTSTAGGRAARRTVQGSLAALVPLPPSQLAALLSIPYSPRSGSLSHSPGLCASQPHSVTHTGVVGMLVRRHARKLLSAVGGGRPGRKVGVGEQAGIGGSSKQVWQRSSTKPFTVLRPWGHRPHSPPPLQPTVEVGPPVLRLHIAPHAVAPPVEAVDVQVEGVEVWGQGLRHAGAYVVASVGAVVPWLAGLFRPRGERGGEWAG